MKYITKINGSNNYLLHLRVESATKKAGEKKLKLISYRKEDDVKATFCEKEGGEDVYNRLSKCFIQYESPYKDVQFTILNILQTDWQFLFKSRFRGKAFNTCIDRTEKNRELLQIFAGLTKTENLEKE